MFVVMLVRTSFWKKQEHEYRKRRDDNVFSVNVTPAEISFQQEAFDANMNNNRATNIAKESEENSARLRISVKSHE